MAGLPDFPTHLSEKEQVEWALKMNGAAQERGATAPAIPILEDMLCRDVPFKWNDLLFVDGLVEASDLNKRFAKAQGRTKPDNTKREGITMLIGCKEVWCRRRNLTVVPDLKALAKVCDEHGISDLEREDATMYLAVENSRIATLPGGGGGLYAF
jgi:hypothetical protein